MTQTRAFYLCSGACQCCNNVIFILSRAGSLMLEKWRTDVSCGIATMHLGVQSVNLVEHCGEIGLP